MSDLSKADADAFDANATPAGWRGFAIAMVMLAAVLGTAAWVASRAAGAMP